MEKGRSLRVPAFGEWNYYYYHYDEPEMSPPALVGTVDSCTAGPEHVPCSDVWFRYSPPPTTRKPASKKMRRPPQGDAAAAASGKQGRRARVLDADVAAGAAAKSTSCRVVRPVDEDLYQVPPPEFTGSRRPRRRKKNLLMGCLVLINCVA